MSKTPRNQEATADFFEHIKVLMEQKPPMPARWLELWAWKDLDLAVSSETFRRCFKGDTDPLTCQVDLLTALMAFFEVGPAELGPYAEHRLTANFAAAGVGPTGTPPGTRTQNLRVFRTGRTGTNRKTLHAVAGPVLSDDVRAA